ncbi:hypothetical protein PPS11_40108 [Pseudomonas putida S11]|nr:hypothetical protein PPS11_40108 [Pseudomonas putida S11]
MPGHAPDLDHRAAGGEGHDNGHLQQHLEGVADFRRRELGKALGAVATLQQEGAAFGDLGKLPAQLARLAREHQRRVAGQGLFDLQQVRGIGVGRLLLDRQGAPAVGAPRLVHLGLGLVGCRLWAMVTVGAALVASRVLADNARFCAGRW